MVFSFQWGTHVGGYPYGYGGNKNGFCNPYFNPVISSGHGDCGRTSNNFGCGRLRMGTISVQHCLSCPNAGCFLALDVGGPGEQRAKDHQDDEDNPRKPNSEFGSYPTRFGPCLVS